MRTRSGWFNRNLGVLLGLLVWLGGVGCSTSEERKQRREEAAVQLYMEARFDEGDKTSVVPVYRANPTAIRLFRRSFLDSAHLEDAAVVDAVGGFAIRLQFDFHGRLALENASVAHRGSRIVVYAMWPETRWLAAPRITSRLTEGTLVFTPDASREEAERIVRGLNNVAIKLGNKPRPSKAPR